MDVVKLDLTEAGDYEMDFYERHGIDRERAYRNYSNIFEAEEMQGIRIGDRWTHGEGEFHTVLFFAKQWDTTIVVSTEYLWCNINSLINGERFDDYIIT